MICLIKIAGLKTKARSSYSKDQPLGALRTSIRHVATLRVLDEDHVGSHQGPREKAFRGPDPYVPMKSKPQVIRIPS